MKEMNDFDIPAMYGAMDARRVERGLSWPGVARALWEQSAVLNQQRGDHPISPATLTGIEKRGDCTCQHALFILRWLDRTPESFLPAPPSHGDKTTLPAVGEDRRLRWDLEAVYDALDQHRHERGLTWKDAAQEMGCTTYQLTGLKTARYAIGMKLMMRIVQWIGRPAATFIYSAHW
jgi:hypothetical protein